MTRRRTLLDVFVAGREPARDRRHAHAPPEARTAQKNTGHRGGTRRCFLPALDRATRPPFSFEFSHGTLRWPTRPVLRVLPLPGRSAPRRRRHGHRLRRDRPRARRARRRQDVARPHARGARPLQARVPVARGDRAPEPRRSRRSSSRTRGSGFSRWERVEGVDFLAYVRGSSAPELAPRRHGHDRVGVDLPANGPSSSPRRSVASGAFDDARLPSRLPRAARARPSSPSTAPARCAPAT